MIHEARGCGIFEIPIPSCLFPILTKYEVDFSLANQSKIDEWRVHEISNGWLLSLIKMLWNMLMKCKTTRMMAWKIADSTWVTEAALSKLINWYIFNMQWKITYNISRNSSLILGMLSVSHRIRHDRMHNQPQGKHTYKKEFHAWKDINLSQLPSQISLTSKNFNHNVTKIVAVNRRPLGDVSLHVSGFRGKNNHNFLPLSMIVWILHTRFKLPQYWS